MYSFKLFNSERKYKKYKVIIYQNKQPIKIIHFGDNRYNDFIEYNKINKELAKQRKQLYIQRHNNNREDFNNFLSPSFWALNILWNKPTLQESIKSIKLY